MRSFLVLIAVGSMVVVGCASADDSATAASEINSAAQCLPTLACDAPPAPALSARGWRHAVQSPLVTLAGAPNHRGRDLFVNPRAPQTVIAKFAYGLAGTNLVVDKDLEDEEVDVFVQRDCGSTWEKLGTAITTTDANPHATVEGVASDAGRIYFEIPQEKKLGPGRHRVRLVVAGDGSSTELFIDVVPPRTPIFISDVDGTLTSSENIELVKLLEDELPDTHPGAPEALRALAAKGYRPIYVTARPEWLVQRTRDFLAKHGFPPGVVHTSTTFLGAGFGDSAARFKEEELAMLAVKGLVPSWGFGNKPSDSQAYAPIPDVKHRIFYQIDGDFTGRRIESYTELLPELERAPGVCAP